MSNLNPTRLGSLASVLIVIAVAINCGKKTEGSQPNTNANSETAASKSSGPAARLDRFVGDWGGYGGRTSAVSGKVGLDSRFIKTNVKRTSGDSLTLIGEKWEIKATLKYDNDSQKYLLSLAAEDFPGVTNVPMTFSETDGFSGETTFKNGSKEFKGTATIKDDKGAAEWQVKLTQGKDFWNLHIRLGKDQ